MVAAETTRRDPQQLRRAAGRSPIRRRGCWRALLPVATHALGYLCDHRLDDIGVGHEALALLLREICRAPLGRRWDLWQCGISGCPITGMGQLRSSDDLRRMTALSPVSGLSRITS
jgi:hypothetical protein